MGKKNIIILVAVAVVFGAGGFFGGMKYQQSKRPTAGGARTAASRTGGAGGNFAGRGGAAGAAGGFTNGQIISKDDKSVTIQTMDGGSKIVFLAGSTQIAKSASGTADDLTTGTNVLVTGTANSDGSITAQSIQIRPAAPAGTPATPPTAQ